MVDHQKILDELVSLLADLRHRQGLSLGAAATLMRERCDDPVSASAVGMYERRERDPSLLRLLQLADIYGVDPAWLLAEAIRSAGGAGCCKSCGRAW